MATMVDEAQGLSLPLLMELPHLSCPPVFKGSLLKRFLPRQWTCFRPLSGSAFRRQDDRSAVDASQLDQSSASIADLYPAWSETSVDAIEKPLAGLRIT